MKRHKKHHHHKPHCGCHPHCSHPPHCGCHPHCGCPPDDCSHCWCAIIFFIELIWGKLAYWYFRVTHLKSKKNPNFIKVAFIGNYKADCGISTYNEDLLLHGLTNPKNTGAPMVLFHVFAEYAEGNRYEKVAGDGDADYITRCWSRCEHPKINLIQKIVEFQPDIVHISHEYGIFPQAYYFTALVSVLKSLGIKVIATMHSVYDHKDKVVTENAPDHLIVHTLEAKQCLVKKGIDANKITVIAHGSPIASNECLLSPEWNTWQSEHTIFHAGFLFSYKGHARMMKAVSRLKNDYPDVHYIIQGSENKRNKMEHDSVYEELIRLAKSLGIEHNVTINRGFVSTEILLSHIRTVKCCVLPYITHPEHNVRATSGIARLIITTETPLVVSDVHLFDDIKPVVDVARSDEELYLAIKRVFDAGGLTPQQKEDRIRFLDKTSWGNVGIETLSLYRKLNQK